MLGGVGGVPEQSGPLCCAVTVSGHILPELARFSVSSYRPPEPVSLPLRSWRRAMLTWIGSSTSSCGAGVSLLPEGVKLIAWEESAMRVCDVPLVTAVMLVLASAPSSRADIKNWQTGETIPGTEGICWGRVWCLRIGAAKTTTSVRPISPESICLRESLVGLGSTTRDSPQRI